MKTSIHFRSRADDPFYRELHGAVHEELSRSGGAGSGAVASLLKAALVLSLIGGLYYLLVFTTQPLPVRLAGVVLLGACFTVCGCSIAHEALHNSLTPWPRLNRLLGFTMDLLGSSGYLWKINHGAHHAFTNIHGRDGDIKDSALLRLCPYAPHRPLHRYQLGTAVALYAVFYLLIVYVFNTLNILGRNFGNGEEVKRHPGSKIVAFLTFKAVYAGIWIVVPLFVAGIPFGEWLAGYLILSVVAGLSFTLVFFVAHNVEEAAFEKDSGEKQLSWAGHQLQTTVNFRTGRLWSSLVGGLNYQVEHHLFPQIPSRHYARIAPVIRATALRYGVPYREHRHFAAAVGSHFRLLRRLSAPPAATGRKEAF